MLRQRVSIRRALVFGMTLLIFATATVLTMRGGHASSLSHRGVSAWRKTPGATPVPMLRIFVHGDDLYPNFMQVPPGVVRLRAENETQGDVALVLERATPGSQPQVLATVSTVYQAKRADLTVELTAGEYDYYDAMRPEIRGHLSVASQ